MEALKQSVNSTTTTTTTTTNNTTTTTPTTTTTTTTTTANNTTDHKNHKTHNHKHKHDLDPKTKVSGKVMISSPTAATPTTTTSSSSAPLTKVAKTMAPQDHSRHPASSPSSQVPSTSEFDSSLIDIAETASNTSSVHTKPSRQEAETDSGSGSTGMSRMKQLLVRRHAHKHKKKLLLGARRQKLLEEAKQKARQSEYEAARLSSRLDILHLFVDHALVDDTFLGKKEINPWRFKNPGLDRKYNFVNNLVTTQELLVIVEGAKQRSRRKGVGEPRLGEEKEEESEKDNEEEKDSSEEKVDNITNDNEEIKNTEPLSETKTVTPRKGKTSRAVSASPNIIYAFGSSHNKQSCHYCGSSQCKGQLNRARMNMNGKRLDSIGQRISDFRGIYQKEKWRLKYTKKIHERIRTIEQEFNDKLVKSSASMQALKK